ncbi:MAG: sulfotransferase [Candidatus Saliniplasma sp.]
MDEETIAVVSGLPRSGTSMMMKMLEMGGIPPLTDHEREANIDNPKGYYEFERVKKLPDDTGWLEEAKGKAVKVLAELIKHLPEGYEYKVIFMERHLEEIIESQKKMLLRKGEDPDDVSDEELYDMFIKYRAMLKEHIKEHPKMEAIYISYNDIIHEPKEHVRRLDRFLDGELNVEKMVEVVDENLYRNRADEI